MKKRLDRAALAASLCLGVFALARCEWAPVDYSGKSCTDQCPEGYVCSGGTCWHGEAPGFDAGDVAGDAGPADDGGPARDSGNPVDAGLQSDTGPRVDAGADAGPKVDAGCDTAGCPLGCCESGTGNCVTAQTTVQCGTGGAACTTCDLDHADRCNSGGCACGTGAACGQGQRCFGAACVCDATSCPDGCCKGLVCTTPSLTACGPVGGPCASCAGVGDVCSAAGACECGGAAPCAAGQRCSAGACVCDAASCPTGCCSAGACTALALATCGAPGAACAACDPVTADGCMSSGLCQCGVAGVPCATGLSCVGGICVCNAAGCATGCCANATTCLPGTANNKCGKNGVACASCGSLNCTDQSCQ